MPKIMLTNQVLPTVMIMMMKKRKHRREKVQKKLRLLMKSKKKRKTTNQLKKILMILKMRKMSKILGLMTRTSQGRMTSQIPTKMKKMKLKTRE